ncbi:helix-turn-helix transcriptional regulator [Brevibacillus sp. HD3.3A]|uniref:helix-turn-helix transcriptional regulator n=1 Tax=Brevibacillus sp. HD3.3A TaxID=2738979 RepID=UPI00156A814A|nr:helix-turn-helix transcriptional regulator [Brevibacillus sp. HD3.3A]UED72091.1 helix-turn-helix transcriptional regulator [Brevibacillus sp. HD3.3A]
MLAVIRENHDYHSDGKPIILSLHDHDGVPAYERSEHDTVEEAKAALSHFDIYWREPDEDDEVSGDVLLLGVIPWHAPELVGLAETAELLGWKKQQVQNYIKRAEEKGWPEGMFPEPIQRLASGPVWTREQIELYKNERKQRRIQMRVKWSRELVIETIHKRAEDNKPLNYQAVVNDDEKLTGAARRLFGSWDNALIAANIGPKTVKNPRVDMKPPGYWSKELIMEEIREITTDGCYLSAHEVQKARPKLYSSATYYFGSWAAAVEAVGLDYKTIRKTNEWDKQKVIEILQTAYKANADLSDKTISALNKSLYGAAINHFGSLKSALEHAGINYEDVRRNTEWSKSKVIHYAKTIIDHNIKLSSYLWFDDNFQSVVTQYFGSNDALYQELSLNEDEAVPTPNNIKFFREKQGISQEELGKQIGLSRTSVGRYERNQLSTPVNVAIQIARVLNTTVEELFR